MKSGKKISKYNIGLDIQTYLDDVGTQPPSDPKALECCGFGYVVAIGESLPPASELIYYSDKFEDCRNPIQAYVFDTWLEATKWALDNCEITESKSIPPRGLERPRFPRVCFLRIYTEVKQI